MSDIREFYTIKYPDRDHPCESVAPISYTTLQRCHLPQVHALLCSTFWPNIDVTDCLDFYPERCTVVACYKRVVVGVVLLSSPAHTYITYLAVKAGWENCQIATKMLYHLIKLSPHRDMTLHVSPSNPAMILYNQFGFKTEEFILGFYEDYLDPRSALSKNAFRLRLRH
ncbi:hypothetical protein FISHEDRAFT_63604 [Fistulina hepatica ATCC 64428]|uniref:N-acetyltransferase domain-containing protein n=1 Tax=Fistulina hepatica ATCC 64428 TaxID=1128425 RepID=A0A0D7AMJ0_9AGAR|nr:hypothetical protein FISHEDRAFT_63604 [Fistulina hepatica ATCC 64428]